MKILLFCGGHIVSGAEIITLNIIRELKALGFDIFCVASGWSNGDFQSRLNDLGIPFINVKLGFVYISKPLWTIDTLIHYPKAIWQIRELIRNFQPDITYHTNHRTLLTTSFLIHRSKNILHIHDPYVGFQSKIYLRLINRLACKYIAVSDFIASNLEEQGAISEKIEVVKNGIKERSMTRIPSHNPVTIGIVGQILKNKGHEDLINACSILEKKNIQFKVCVIGHGEAEYLNFLKEAVNDKGLASRFEWLGYIKTQEKIYELIDIVVVPSNVADPFPTSAIEAGLYFKPCIVTNVGGLPEIIIEGKTGFIITPKNPEELSKKILDLIRNENLLNDLGKNAQKHITSNFTLEKQISKIVTILNQC